MFPWETLWCRFTELIIDPLVFRQELGLGEEDISSPSAYSCSKGTS